MGKEEVAADHHKIRVISVYATKWRFTGDPDPGIKHLELGQLEEFYTLYKDQLPQIIRRTPHTPGSLMFLPTDDEAEERGKDTKISPAEDDVEVLSMESWLFVLPSDQVVAAYDFELGGRTVPDPDSGPDAVTVDPLPAIRLLERCAYARLIIDGRPIEAHIAYLLADEEYAKEVRMLETAEPQQNASEPFPPERHQIVFATQIKAPALQTTDRAGPDGVHRVIRTSPDGDDATIRQILYRIEPPNRPEFVEYERPPGLNHAGTLCAVTPYVSLLSDHPEYLENSVFLTVVQTVGTAARFRQIWHKAHREVRKFRREDQDETIGTQGRDKLEELADVLGNLELDLSFSVETSADLGLLIPSLRIESFHKELYRALELRERAETVSRMFSRLEASIRAELTAIEIRDRREDEKKRRLETEERRLRREEEEQRLRREEEERRLRHEEEEDRRVRWGFAIGVVSFLAIPIGFLSAFFGLNVQQVQPGWSVFNYHHYWLAYVAAAILTAIPPALWWYLGRTLPRRRARAEQARTPRA